MKAGTLRTLVVMAVLAVSATVLAVGAQASSQLRFNGGSTRLVVNPAVLPVLAAHHITLAPVAPATAAAARWDGSNTIAARFPITGGHVDGSTLQGIINHSGGLTFSKGSKSLTVGLFRISIHARAYLSGAVNLDPSARVSLLRLDLSHARVTAKGSWVTVSGVRAYLTKTAATALNATLGTSVFAPGLKLGVAQVHAHLAS
jgi:hypothetical protein